MYNFVTLQFIDRNSKSIENKNLIEIDGRPLWTYNASLAKSSVGVERTVFGVSDSGEERFCIRKNYIVTTYSKEELGPESDSFAFVPKTAFDTGVCPLSNRVRDAVNFIEGVCKEEYDGYVVLLGNSRLFDESRFFTMLWLFCLLRRTTDFSGIMPVTNLAPFCPYRAHMKRYGAFLEQAISASPIYGRIGNTNGEDRKDGIACSWFYNGGPMIFLRDRVRIPSSIDNCNDWGAPATHIPYLGDAVYGFCMEPLDCIELDAPWQIGMMSLDYRDMCKKLLSGRGVAI